VTSPLLSVIIPTLDEAANLPSILADLRAQQGIGLEIIVADGGSRDVTRELAARYGAILVAAPPGRGRQMNAGALAASGGFLLFLHADSRLTDVFMLRNAGAFLEQAEIRAGRRRLAGVWTCASGTARTGPRGRPRPPAQMAATASPASPA